MAANGSVEWQCRPGLASPGRALRVRHPHVVEVVAELVRLLHQRLAVREVVEVVVLLARRRLPVGGGVIQTPLSIFHQ